MAQYTIALDKFYVLTTRSVHEDTDYVTLTVQVNQQTPLNQTIFVGDVNDGMHPVNLQLGPVDVGPNDTLALNYVVLNKGHANGDRQAIENGLASAATQAVVAQFPSLKDYQSFIQRVISALINLIDADCDGPCAAQQFKFSGAEVEHLTSTTGTFYQRIFDEIESPVGCGDSGRYVVRWHIAQVGGAPKGFASTPAFFQSGGNHQGNFEVIVPRAEGGLAHFYRENSEPDLPWYGPNLFGTNDHYEAVSFIQTSFRGRLSFEGLARTGTRLDYYWRDGGPPFTWHGPWTFFNGATGTPAFFQSGGNNQGNFEVIVPRAEGGLAHFWRDNSKSDLPWTGPLPFGTNDHYEAVSFIQTSFRGRLSFEGLARTGTRLDYYWRDGGPPFTWHGPFHHF